MNKKMRALVAAFLLVFALAGCGNGAANDSATATSAAVESSAAQESKASYTQIATDEAAAQIAETPDAVIVDVRTPEEFAEGHIPEAINIPNDTITDAPIIALPDKEQPIFVYCRSGNRSKDAAQKLADLGYTKVIEFGGIKNWSGEIVTGNTDADTAGAESDEKGLG